MKMRIPRIPKLDGVMLDMSNIQLQKLASGMSVKIVPKMLSGNGVAVGLTLAQRKRLISQCQSGDGLVARGTSLKLTKKQLHHHMLHGTGIFSDLIRQIWGYTKQGYQLVKPVIKPILEEGWKEIRGVLQDEGVKLLKKGVSSGTKRTVDKIQATSNDISDKLGFNNSDDVQARGQLPVVMSGNGFVKDSLVKLIKGGARIAKEDVAPVLIQEGKKVLVNEITKKLRGGNVRVAATNKRRVRKMVGSAIFM